MDRKDRAERWMKLDRMEQVTALVAAAEVVTGDPGAAAQVLFDMARRGPEGDAHRLAAAVANGMAESGPLVMTLVERPVAVEELGQPLPLNPVEPHITAFEVTPPVVPVGGMATLRWLSKATLPATVVVEPPIHVRNDILPLPLCGEITFVPSGDEDKDYQLIVQNEHGVAKRTVRVQRPFIKTSEDGVLEFKTSEDGVLETVQRALADSTLSRLMGNDARGLAAAQKRAEAILLSAICHLWGIANQNVWPEACAAWCRAMHLEVDGLADQIVAMAKTHQHTAHEIIAGWDWNKMQIRPPTEEEEDAKQAE